MNALPFDTHRVVKRLTEAGFSEPQAETVTDVLREARQSELSDLATKSDLALVTADLAETKAELKADIALLRSEMLGEIGKLRSDLRAEIAESRAETLKWMIGLLLVQGGLIVGILRLLPTH